MEDIRPSAQTIAMQAFDTMMEIMKGSHPELSYHIIAKFWITPTDLPEFVQEVTLSGDL